MSTKFFTNEGSNTLIQKFKGIFENNKDIHFFDALVGYFRASGYFKIRPYLNDVPNIRILIGINVDKILAQYQSRGLLFQGDAQQTVIEFINETKNEIQNASYEKEVEDGILQFIEDIATKKIELKAHPSKKLHAKIYIFRPENWNEHKSGHVITGSSNLTEDGLGAGRNINYEFNVILSEFEDVKFATSEFERLWQEGISILPIDVEQLRKERPNIIVAGDYNIAHQAIDIHDPKGNKKSSGFLPEERAWMDELLANNWVDSFRHMHEDATGAYSWWSQRFPSVRLQNKGWRIDYLCTTKVLSTKIKAALILPDIKHSDHCPIVIEIKK